jgi:hypothetical protein
MDEWQEALGREPSATDQPPGFYRYRAGRKCPWQPLRILWDGEFWHVLLIGKPVRGSCEKDPLDIPFVRDRGPFHPITMRQYHDMLDDYRAATPGSPLLTPDVPVNLREARPL